MHTINPKTAEFTNSLDTDEAAHNELLRQDLHCLSSSLLILNMVQLDKTIIEFFTDANFVVAHTW